MDTEADSLHSYPERLCLVQISIPGADVLIDPLAGFDLSPLWSFLRERDLILHGADYDLRLLYRTCGFVPGRIFDTMLAERFLGGTRFGLTDLASKYLGVTLEKGPQKANWARRPLTERMIVYARNDTRYLEPIASHLRDGLRQHQRLEWHREACDQLIATCASPRETGKNWRLKGSERLPRRSLAVLREIWHWRESEALAARKPPYFVLSHESMVEIAARAPADGVENLIPPYVNGRRRQGLLDAVARGIDIPEHACPTIERQVQKRLSDSAHQRLNLLKTRRDRRAGELGLDPAFIASRATLIALADRWPDHPGDLMAWQRSLLEAD